MLSKLIPMSWLSWEESFTDEEVFREIMTSTLRGRWAEFRFPLAGGGQKVMSFREYLEAGPLAEKAVLLEVLDKGGMSALKLAWKVMVE